MSFVETHDLDDTDTGVTWLTRMRVSDVGFIKIYIRRQYVYLSLCTGPCLCNRTSYSLTKSHSF